MLLSKRLFKRYINHHGTILRFVTTTTKENDDLHFKPKFTNAEQTKILTIVNEANADELLKFDVTRGRIKNLETWRLRNGPFRSLSEILEVEGLGEKVLERLCKSIILNRTSENNVKTKNTNRKQLVTPQLDKNLIKNLQSVVSIHACSTGFSWTKMSIENNEVQAWNFQDFSLLPKKMLPTETYDLAVQILMRLPDANVYVMEAAPGMSPQTSQSVKTMPTYTQQLELTSMLLALINSSPKHGVSEMHRQNVSNEGNGGFDNNISRNKVYYLRTYLSARLFKTLVGNERVSSGAIMEKLLQKSADLPCTPITTTGDIQNEFFSQSAVHKDLLGQALLLAVSFMDLCIYQNPVSLQTINKGRKN